MKLESAVISVGENPYEHPNEKVLMRLKNVNTYRTDNQNTIWLKSDGNSVDINPIKDCILDGANRKISYESILNYAFLIA